MPRVIQPDDILPTVAEWAVPRRRSSKCCCGWYYFYSADCGHVHTKYKHCCGTEISAVSLRRVFCHRPAPHENFSAVVIAGLCTGCSSPSDQTKPS
jgi:hypothetical protein